MKGTCAYKLLISDKQFIALKLLLSTFFIYYLEHDYKKSNNLPLQH